LEYNFFIWNYYSAFAYFLLFGFHLKVTTSLRKKKKRSKKAVNYGWMDHHWSEKNGNKERE